MTKHSAKREHLNNRDQEIEKVSAIYMSKLIWYLCNCAKFLKGFVPNTLFDPSQWSSIPFDSIQPRFNSIQLSPIQFKLNSDYEKSVKGLRGVCEDLWEVCGKFGTSMSEFCGVCGNFVRGPCEFWEKFVGSVWEISEKLVCGFVRHLLWMLPNIAPKASPRTTTTKHTTRRNTRGCKRHAREPTTAQPMSDY